MDELRFELQRLVDVMRVNGMAGYATWPRQVLRHDDDVLLDFLTSGAVWGHGDSIAVHVLRMPELSDNGRREICNALLRLAEVQRREDPVHKNLDDWIELLAT